MDTHEVSEINKKINSIGKKLIEVKMLEDFYADEKTRLSSLFPLKESYRLEFEQENKALFDTINKSILSLHKSLCSFVLHKRDSILASYEGIIRDLPVSPWPSTNEEYKSRSRKNSINIM